MTNIFKENSGLICGNDKSTAFQSFEFKQCLAQGVSKFQTIDVYDTKAFGRVLVLDDIVQLTEMDEFIYSEMLTHVPMFEHHCPKNILIVGGGDGCVLREVLKHKTVESVVILEIDREVMNIAEDFFNADFNDERLQVINEDALQAIKTLNRKFDVVIIDSTDPQTSGGKSIYSKHFMSALSNRVSENGVISMMAGVPMVQGLGHVKEINRLMHFLGFNTDLYTTTVPTYYGGLTAMMIYWKNGVYVSDKNMNIVNTKHYDRLVHDASFVKPQWLKDMI